MTDSALPSTDPVYITLGRIYSYLNIRLIYFFTSMFLSHYFNELCVNKNKKTSSPEHLLLQNNSKKEVFQPHLPVRLPCYDLAPVTGFALGRSLRSRTSGTPSFHGLTGGVYKARERIHRAMADARLLANPASWSRVADSSPN